MTYPGVQCFWVEPAGIAALYLRRASLAVCPKRHYGHEARAYFGTCNARLVNGQPERHPIQYPPRHHPLWPRRCDCGYQFTRADDYQEDYSVLWRRVDTGDVIGSVKQAPPGAMYDAWWLERKGDDGQSIVAVCPDGAHWAIDEPSANCTMPNEHRHHCWVRHNRVPKITVDANGFTCAGGGGSVKTDHYHGTLIDGAFSPG